MLLYVKTNNWKEISSEKEALYLTKKINNYLKNEPDQVPQWIERLGLLLPENGYLPLIKKEELGWQHNIANDKTISKCTLIKCINNKPISYFSLESTYSKSQENLDVTIQNFYIIPDNRKTGISNKMINEITHIIINQYKICNTTKPLVLNILIGSIKGERVFENLKQSLQKQNIPIETNISIDPTY